MRVIVVKDPQTMGKRAADLIQEVMESKPHFVLGLATGSTPMPLYKELIRRHKDEKLDFSTVITFNLDEYVGLKPTHDQSYRYFMNKHLFDHININKKCTHVPCGIGDDLEAECLMYEEMIEDVGGVDYQVLGIGSNGHIGFNEPGTSLASRTHVTQLTESTIKDNSRMFAKVQDVPTQAVTMGIGTVLDAERVVLVANGANKTKAIKAALEGPITAMCPASALQLHPGVTYVITEDCAKGLTIAVER